MTFLVVGRPLSDPGDVDYVPSVYGFKKLPKLPSRSCRMERRHAHREEESQQRKRVEQEQQELEILQMEAAAGLLMMNLPTSVATQTEVKRTVDSYQQTKTNTRNVHALTEATEDPGNQPITPQTAISAESLHKNDDKTRFYTGLPKWSLVLQIFSLVSPFISLSHTRLTLQDELVLVLVKLRLNSPFQDLAYRWGISISTITRMFHKWIDAMSVRMKFIIKWPTKDVLQHNLPQVFKETYPNTVCIIDYGEDELQIAT